MSTERVESIPLVALVPSPTNPRRSMSDAGLQELADSIRQVGLQQPIVVRPSPTEWHGGVRAWEIVFGHRRVRAAELAELEMIPAIPRVMTDDQAALAQLAENLQREDMSALDEADAVVRLRADLGLQPDIIARELGKSRSWVYGRLKLGGAAQQVRLALAGEDVNAPLPPDIALEIARLPVMAEQRAALKRVQGYGGEWVSVREAQRLVRAMVGRQEIRIEHFDPTDADLVPQAGTCTACPKRAGNDPDLVAAGIPEQACTDSTCYADKRLAASYTKLEALAAAGRRVASRDEAERIFAQPLSRGDWVDVADMSLGPTRLEDVLQALAKDAPPPLHAVDPETGALLRLLTDGEVEQVTRQWRAHQARARGEAPGPGGAEQTSRRGAAWEDEDEDDGPDPMADWTPAERAAVDITHLKQVRKAVLERAATAERNLDELRMVLLQQLEQHGGEPWGELLPALGTVGIVYQPVGAVLEPGGDWWAEQIPRMNGAQLAAVLVLDALYESMRLTAWMKPHRRDGPDRIAHARKAAARRVALAECYGVDVRRAILNETE